MQYLNFAFDMLIFFLPFLITTIAVIAVLWGAHRFIIVRNANRGNEHLLPRQLFMLGLIFTGLVAITISLPISENTRNQILILIGIITSGIFAFSSTTIFANLMAGIMLRVTKPFATGDFISVGTLSGRVTERGLLDTEIQTEDRRLVALPNTHMISNPVSVVRGSGTIVAVTLSLGYDIHYSQIESLLLEAIKGADLEEPFVQILELGNFSITYKACGMLTDVKVLLSAHSNLRRKILDILHNNGIEIVSPTFMNQRQLPDNQLIIPAAALHKSEEQSTIAEEVVFDKAEEAEQHEKEKQRYVDIIKQSEQDLENASTLEKKQLKETIKVAREQLKITDIPNIEE